MSQSRNSTSSSSSSSSEYIYNWWDEYGKDPFKSYLDNENERRELEEKIQTVIRLAINRPSKDPLVVNQPLVDFATNLATRYADKPGLLWYFYRIAAIPDPLTMEKQRQTKCQEMEEEKRYRDAYNRLSKEEQIEYDNKLLALTKQSHSGHWQYHDDDCLCWKYFDDSYCNRGGYSWSCCGATTESSGCYKASYVSDAEIRKKLPLPGYHDQDEKVSNNEQKDYQEDNPF